MGGKFLFIRYFVRQARMPPLSRRMLNCIVIAVSLFGIAGIALVALDRMVLSGVSNSAYSELLRCAPGLARRRLHPADTAALWRLRPVLLRLCVGDLFLLKGEEITGWAAALAQLSIVSPVVYALLYSGRMPILLVLVLIAAAMLDSPGAGAAGIAARPLSSHQDSRRGRAVCHLFERDLDEPAEFLHPDVAADHRAAARRRFSARYLLPMPASRPRPARRSRQRILTSELQRRVRLQPPEQKPSSVDAILAMMLEAWNVKPRVTYVSRSNPAAYRHGRDDRPEHRIPI